MVRYYCFMDAPIEEIFTSIQGEGPWTGQRHIFVRFIGCDIACRYCDTPSAVSCGSGPIERACRAQKSAASFDYEQIPRRLSPQELTRFCRRLTVPGPSRPTVSLTGGEPLLHHAFLAAWLPEIKNTYTIYLETNGIHEQAMTSLQNMVDVVSMDFKLPSASGLRPFWDEHKRFLAAARGTTLFVKAVVTADTSKDDVLTSASLIAAYDSTVPLIIQPAGGPLRPAPLLLIEFQNAALGLLQDVRVIPQSHKMLKVP